MIITLCGFQKKKNSIVLKWTIIILHMNYIPTLYLDDVLTGEDLLDYFIKFEGGWNDSGSLNLNGRKTKVTK